MIDPEKDITWSESGMKMRAELHLVWERRIPEAVHGNPRHFVRHEMERDVMERLYGGQESLVNRVIAVMSDPSFTAELHRRSYGNNRFTAGIMVANKLGIFHDLDGNIIPPFSSVSKPEMNTGELGQSLTVPKPSCLSSQVVEGENPSGGEP